MRGLRPAHWPGLPYLSRKDVEHGAAEAVPCVPQGVAPVVLPDLVGPGEEGGPAGGLEAAPPVLQVAAPVLLLATLQVLDINGVQASPIPDILPIVLACTNRATQAALISLSWAFEIECLTLAKPPHVTSDYS